MSGARPCEAPARDGVLADAQWIMPLMIDGAGRRGRSASGFRDLLVSSRTRPQHEQDATLGTLFSRMTGIPSSANLKDPPAPQQNRAGKAAIA